MWSNVVLVYEITGTGLQLLEQFFQFGCGMFFVRVN